MRLVFILFTCTSFLLCNAQKGYKNKRFLSSFDLGLSPAFFSQGIRNSSILNNPRAVVENTGTFDVQIRPEITTEFLYLERYSVGLIYRRLVNGVAYQEETDPPEITRFGYLKGNAFGLFLKGYAPGSLPPIGYYTKLGFSIVRANAYRDLSDNQKLFDEDLGNFMFQYEIGRQIIIADQILLKLSSEIGYYAVDNFLVWSQLNPGRSRSDLFEQSLAFYSLFKFKLGLGLIY